MTQDKITLAGKDGKSDVDNAANLIAGLAKIKNGMPDLEAERAKLSLNTDFSKDVDQIKTNFIKSGYLDEAGELVEKHALASGNLTELRKWGQKNPTLIAEIADNGRCRVFERTGRYSDAGESYVVKSKIETADDDRVLGIPYAQAMAGDRVYIVNGKIFTGWALYFSLSSIRSPEDYARNVDLVWNVPYLYASLLLKAQLGLGCGLDVNYGTEANEVPEEKLIRKYLNDKLKLDVNKLIKTGFHLGAYGNAYWALRRDAKGIVDKVTILQPERLKIFLDPMTTKILFYIYLPPIIGGTTIASYPSDGRFNPNILAGVTLSYPTPIVMHPEDVMHFKVNNFTEYPFGFSDVKTCLDPATARLDINILAPILYKKYTKPMIHWRLNMEGLGSKQVETKKNEMIALLEDMEPGSDPVTTNAWESVVIAVGSGKSDILDLTSDVDTQIFAATGVPETYFKPKGSTDRMISEQDKTFLARAKIPQTIVAEEIEEKLIGPRLYYELQQKEMVRNFMGEYDVVEEILTTYDSWLASEPKLPKVVWKETFKQDETQSIANAIALLNAGIIDANRAAMKIGEISESRQKTDDLNKVGLDDPLSGKKIDPIQKENPILGQDKRERGNTPSSFNEQETMEAMRGGNETNAKFRPQNSTKVKDPSQLGGSRYAQHETKGEAGAIQEKHKPAFQEDDEVELKNVEEGSLFVKKK